MNDDTHSLEEQAVASAFASLGKKRVRDDHAAGGGCAAKIARVFGPALMPQAAKQVVDIRTLRPAPFFNYRDFSTVEDPDPLTPPTPPGRVPNFPAKMHAILSRPELADIIGWMPHGRSWRVLKPREFEILVMPTYFEQSKFSSFIRQANGWGFRRITQGRDRNSYYHELFLRGIPHLCKQMKRPGVAQKAAADADHEPDFHRISEMHPVPEEADDESIMLKCTVQGGPKARMPVYCGPSEALKTDSLKMLATSIALPELTSVHQALVALNNQISMSSTKKSHATNVFLTPHNPFAAVTPFTVPAGLFRSAESPYAMSTLNTAAASQFAAGFAAATALSGNDIYNMLGQALELQVIAPMQKNVSPLNLQVVTSQK